MNRFYGAKFAILVSIVILAVLMLDSDAQGDRKYKISDRKVKKDDKSMTTTEKSGNAKEKNTPGQENPHNACKGLGEVCYYARGCGQERTEVKKYCKQTEEEKDFYGEGAGTCCKLNHVIEIEKESAAKKDQQGNKKSKKKP